MPKRISIEGLKRQARSRRNEDASKTLTQHLEELSREHGYKTYAALRAEQKALQ